MGVSTATPGTMRMRVGTEFGGALPTAKECCARHGLRVCQATTVCELDIIAFVVLLCSVMVWCYLGLATLVRFQRSSHDTASVGPGDNTTCSPKYSCTTLVHPKPHAKKKAHTGVSGPRHTTGASTPTLARSPGTPSMDRAERLYTMCLDHGTH